MNPSLTFLYGVTQRHSLSVLQAILLPTAHLLRQHPVNQALLKGKLSPQVATHLCVQQNAWLTNLSSRMRFSSSLALNEDVQETMQLLSSILRHEKAALNHLAAELQKIVPDFPDLKENHCPEYPVTIETIHYNHHLEYQSRRGLSLMISSILPERMLRKQVAFMLMDQYISRTSKLPTSLQKAYHEWLMAGFSENSKETLKHLETLFLRTVNVSEDTHFAELASVFRTSCEYEVAKLDGVCPKAQSKPSLKLN